MSYNDEFSTTSTKKLCKIYHKAQIAYVVHAIHGNLVAAIESLDDAIFLREIVMRRSRVIDNGHKYFYELMLEEYDLAVRHLHTYGYVYGFRISCHALVKNAEKLGFIVPVWIKPEIAVR